MEPRSTANVQVIMQAQKEYPADMAACKDKFLVQTEALPPGEVRWRWRCGWGRVAARVVFAC